MARQKASVVLAASGTISFDGADLSLFNEPAIAAGDTFTGENGQELPASLFYTDAAGGGTTYLPVRMIADLFDADIFWSNGKVLLGGYGGAASSISTSSDGSVLEMGVENPDSRGAFPFTQSEAKTPAAGAETTSLQARAQYKAAGDFNTVLSCDPAQGNYVTITLTNHGAAGGQNLLINVTRLKTVGQDCGFKAVEAAPGETVTLTYQVDDSATRLNDKLGLNVTWDKTKAPDYTMDITVEAVQFDAE